MFLLILASVPLASIVFVFGGVGPEDLLRGYALLFALAFGMGALGLFISALVRRTQTATVLTFVAVLALTLGSMAVHEFWRVVTTPPATPNNGFISVAHAGHGRRRRCCGSTRSWVTWTSSARLRRAATRPAPAATSRRSPARPTSGHRVNTDPCRHEGAVRGPVPPAPAPWPAWC